MFATTGALAPQRSPKGPVTQLLRGMLRETLIAPRSTFHHSTGYINKKLSPGCPGESFLLLSCVLLLHCCRNALYLDDCCTAQLWVVVEHVAYTALVVDNEL